MLFSDSTASELHSPKFLATQSTPSRKSNRDVVGQKRGFMTCLADYGETILVHCSNCGREKEMKRLSWTTCTGVGRACGCRRGGQAVKRGQPRVRKLEEVIAAFDFDKAEQQQITRIVWHCVARLQMSRSSALKEARAAVYFDREDFQRSQYAENPLLTDKDREFEYRPRLACHGGEEDLY